MAGAAVLLCAPVAWAGEGDTPAAKLIAGKPAILDYGSGVKVPCSRDAFFTLWEGDRFWLTFGFGRCPSNDIALIRANKQAYGVMKFMLLTLAFAPERLVRGDGNGWRKKNPTAHDFVVGALDLPLQPGKPVSDVFLGGGNIEINEFMNMGGGTEDGPPTNPQQANRNAFCSKIILKKDLSLDDVRKRAVVFQI